MNENWTLKMFVSKPSRKLVRSPYLEFDARHSVFNRVIHYVGSSDQAEVDDFEDFHTDQDKFVKFSATVSLE